MKFSLDGRVALVTGSSTGLGKAIAIELVRAGASVAMNYFNNYERAEKALAEVHKISGKAVMLRADVSDAASVDELCMNVEQEFGPVDILIPNATPDQPQMPIEQYTWQHYQTMIDFFIKSPYLLTSRCLSAMKAKKYGRIINITSEVYHRSHSNFSAYVSAKGGQIGWTRSMATELAPFGITVNSVAPGWIPVERHDSVDQVDRDRYEAMIPAGRWGTPADIANSIIYYASDEASFVTGQTLCVNGGITPW